MSFRGRPFALKRMFHQNREKIRTWYIKKGLNYQEIATKLGCSRVSAKHYLKEIFPHASHYPKRRLMNFHKRKIIKDYANGLVSDDIAKKYNVSRETVLRYLELWQVEKRPNHRPAKWSEYVRSENNSAMRALYRVREFYKHTCFHCGKQENPKSDEYDMEVHHSY